MSAKLRIKTKEIEIEWEGEVEFLKSEVPALIASIVEAIGSGGKLEEFDEAVRDSSDEAIPSRFTTASAAAKVQAQTGPELFKVALAKLQSDGVEPAPRAQIHKEMQSASKFYKQSMLNNLNRTIDSLLTSGEVNEPEKGVYALTHVAQEALLKRISQ
jgi:hypothetical protein